jgi:peptidoglycan/xylan/chitin deacetylase (PgdA/CDA1 family)
MKQQLNEPGKFVISLDFEINWGVRDQQTLEQYGANLRGVRQVVPALLALFKEYNLRVTWATVGLLFFDNKTTLLENLPVVRPQYADPNLSPYQAMDMIGDNETVDPYHFGNSLINQIRTTPGQEIATHTFCHYYCLERGQTAQEFRHDLEAAIRVARAQGLELRSLVFPRNQANIAYLPICAELGITSYRGNETSWIYKERTEEQQSLYKRGARLLDAYLSLSGHNCYALSDIAQNFPFNIPASRFLRPWSAQLSVLEEIRLKRILSGMTHAARHGLLFHLWWHPHNFGVNLPENMTVLRRITDHYRSLHLAYGFKSQTMADVAELLQVQGLQSTVSS